jgi:hypothetical protein
MGENRLEVTLSVPETTPLNELINDNYRLVSINEPDDYTDTLESSFSEGDFLIDETSPTPSPEANTVQVTSVTDIKASDYMVEETGKTVAEHNEFYPKDDRVIIGYYPHMSGDNKEFAFPESRLSRV